MRSMKELSVEQLEAILAWWLKDYTLEECHDMGGEFEAAERELEHRFAWNWEDELTWYEKEYIDQD